MTLNLAKCDFGKAEVKFVGRMVDLVLIVPILSVWRG